MNLFRTQAAKVLVATKNYVGATIKKLASRTQLSKSAFYRHKKSQKARIKTMGHDFFETEEGQEWLRRLFYAIILVFGLQSGVGSETISFFFSIINVNAYVGTSPSSIRQIKNELRAVLESYGATFTAEVLQRCKDKELHLGGDETFFRETLFLILMELSSGFIITEAKVDNRKLETWKENTLATLKPCEENVASFSADGGKALIGLGKLLGCCLATT